MSNTDSLVRIKELHKDILCRGNQLRSLQAKDNSIPIFKLRKEVIS